MREVALEIAIAIDRTTETRLLELADIIIDVRRIEPSRERIGIDQALQHRLADRLVLSAPTAVRIRRRCVVELAQAAAHIGFKLGLGNAFVLEVRHVEKLALIGPHRLEDVVQRRRRQRVIRDRKPRDRAHFARMQHSRVPRNRRAPIVTDDDRRRIRRERLDHARDISCHVRHRVSVNIMRLIGAAITAHIDRARGETSSSQRRKLMAPRIPTLRKTVHEYDKRPLALHGGADLDTVGLNDFERVAHSTKSLGNVGCSRMRRYASQRSSCVSRPRST